MKVRVPRRNSIFQVLFFRKSDALRLRHRRSPPHSRRDIAPGLEACRTCLATGRNKKTRHSRPLKRLFFNFKQRSAKFHSWNPEELPEALLPGGSILKLLFKRFLADPSGATAIEYALIAADISYAIIAAVNGLGTTLNASYAAIDTALK
jgi:pilus assembly protein Flp/PilA